MNKYKQHKYNQVILFVHFNYLLFNKIILTFLLSAIIGILICKVLRTHYQIMTHKKRQ